jgi:hypothetical protein
MTSGPTIFVLGLVLISEPCDSLMSRSEVVTCRGLWTRSHEDVAGQRACSEWGTPRNEK